MLDLEQIGWEKSNQPIGWQLKCKLLLLDLFVVYARLLGSRRQETQETGANFRQILKAVAYIEQHFDQEIPLRKSPERLDYPPDTCRASSDTTWARRRPNTPAISAWPRRPSCFAKTT